MNVEQMRELQAPIKARYKDDPETAVITLKARGEIGQEGLAACAGVTLSAVATALGINVRQGTVEAEGDLDFRGTLGVAKDAPVGFRAIRLRFDLDSDADDEKLATLLKLTERYCVVLQTLKVPAETSAT